MRVRETFKLYEQIDWFTDVPFVKTTKEILHVKLAYIAHLSEHPSFIIPIPLSHG